MRQHLDLDSHVLNDDGLSFREWYRLADKHMNALCGLDVDDFPDGPSWSNWEAGIDPKDYATEVFQKAAAEMEGMF